MAQGDHWSGLALCGAAAGALQIPEKQQELWAESETGAWLQPVSFPLVSRKLLRNPWGKGQVPPAPPVLSPPVTSLYMLWY